MRLGLVSDVHANRVALEAVLDDMPDVDRVLCAGDVVGYNPWPAECVDRVREVCVATVEGNHDRNVETPERYRANRMAYQGLQLAKQRCTDEQRAWLSDLPRSVELVDGLFVVHDHPERVDEYVRPHQFPALEPHLEGYDACVLGHTHVQHAEHVGGTLVVNPGSVGQPRDGDPRAGYAVLDADDWTAETHRVPYDVESVQTAIEAADLPKQTAKRLAEGR